MALLQWPWHYYPPIELARFKAIDFFPPRPTNLGEIAQWRSICLGTKNRTIGDALMLSTLPSKLKREFPNLKVYVYPRGFNRAVFYANPFVDGIRYLPDAIYGDDVNWGEGHLIQLKERFFELPVSDSPRPEIHLTSTEIAWAESLRSGQPVCVLHPSGHTWQNVVQGTFWLELVQRAKNRYAFWQVGVEGQTRIEGCARHFLLPKSYRNVRKLFALMKCANKFIGIDSGPMHVARAHLVPSLILTRGGDIRKIFERRKAAPYFLNRNREYAFLYEENTHADVSMGTPAALNQNVDAFLS